MGPKTAHCLPCESEVCNRHSQGFDPWTPRLQSGALPLGYEGLCKESHGSPSQGLKPWTPG